MGSDQFFGASHNDLPPNGVKSTIALDMLLSSLIDTLLYNHDQIYNCII